MARNVNDIIERLSAAQRKKVEARAAQLIAEETGRDLHPLENRAFARRT